MTYIETVAEFIPHEESVGLHRGPRMADAAHAGVLMANLYFAFYDRQKRSPFPVLMVYLRAIAELADEMLFLRDWECRGVKA